MTHKARPPALAHNTREEEESRNKRELEQQQREREGGFFKTLNINRGGKRVTSLQTPGGWLCAASLSPPPPPKVYRTLLSRARAEGKRE